MVRDSVTRKFDRLYRKDYECYEIVTLVNIPPKKELLDLAKSASSWILEKVIQEDEEFERAVKVVVLATDLRVGLRFSFSSITSDYFLKIDYKLAILNLM